MSNIRKFKFRSQELFKEWASQEYGHSRTIPFWNYEFYGYDYNGSISFICNKTGKMVLDCQPPSLAFTPDEIKMYLIEFDITVNREPVVIKQVPLRTATLLVVDCHDKVVELRWNEFKDKFMVVELLGDKRTTKVTFYDTSAIYTANTMGNMILDLGYPKVVISNGEIHTMLVRDDE